MANATNSGLAAARNTLSPITETCAAVDTGPVHSGLVGHPLLTPTTQVQILSVVDATGSAPIGDIIAELPGHADPVGAVFALIAAGVLEVQSTGIIDAHSIVARSGSMGLHGSQDCRGGPVPGGPADADDEMDRTAAEPQPIDFAGFAAETLPCDLQMVPTAQLLPQIIAGPGSRRPDFGRAECLARPGVYVQLRGHEAYVGYGSSVGARIATGRQIPTPDCIIAIVDAQDRLSEDDGKALERILWTRVTAETEFALVNGVPDGAAVEHERYDQLDLFAGEIVLALRQADLMFRSGSVREHLAGPRAEPGRLGAPRRIDDLPDGRVKELNYCGLTALAAERKDGSWLLLRGSDVRIDTVASANASASYQRAAWLHAGLLEPAVDGSCYVLKRDLVFSSGSAVGHFVSGSKGFGLSAWVPIDEDEADPAGPAL